MPNIDEPESTAEANATLNARDHERVLSSIRGDARKIREALTRLQADADKLIAGGSYPAAAVLTDSIRTIHVGLSHLGGVFKVEI